jgi:hypothetical protein
MQKPTAAVSFLNFTKSITRVIQSRRIRGTVHVAYMGEMRNAHSIFVGNLREETTWKT